MKIYKFVKAHALYLAFIQVWAATLGSLYFSEVLQLRPCPLCWYQRILMYPLALIFAVAILRKDKNVAYYALPFGILGIIISLYQYLLQMTPLQRLVPVSCSELESCSKIDFIVWGFVTIPFLSLISFAVITLLMFLIMKGKNK